MNEYERVRRARIRNQTRIWEYFPCACVPLREVPIYDLRRRRCGAATATASAVRRRTVRCGYDAVSCPEKRGEIPTFWARLVCVMLV